MSRFLQTLREQRWDDHRYYHQSRVNQALHLVSALSFIVAYALLFVDPALAAILGWCFSMTTRQSGHFFFEPRGFDRVNGVSDEYKEAVKVGYNIHRKIVLIVVWAAVPAVLWLWPSLGGLIEPATNWRGLVHDTGIAWLALAVGGLLFRVAQLVVLQGPLAATAWMVKILTDPFHDVMLYWRAPFALCRGEWIDPMHHVRPEAPRP